MSKFNAKNALKSHARVLFNQLLPNLYNSYIHKILGGNNNTIMPGSNLSCYDSHVDWSRDLFRLLSFRYYTRTVYRVCILHSASQDFELGAGAHLNRLVHLLLKLV